MKKILFPFLLVLFFLVVWNASLIGYGIEQGIGQLKIIWQARPISEVLSDSDFPAPLKKKLNMIGGIKTFAIDTLGLSDTDNYTTVFDQKGKEVMWVVTACKPFSLTPKIWHFPIVGEMPYKGFFNRKKAYNEIKNLQAVGWETGISNPGGWSTLGWFTDPLLSGMLVRNEGKLASLIIHEMVHATVFIKDSVQFNENLASFIADSAAYNFLAWKYGRQSATYKAYMLETMGHQRYNDHMLRGAYALDSLYKTFTPQTSHQAKKKQKEALIRTIVTLVDTLTLYTFEPPISRLKTVLPNNDYFMTYMRYESKKSLLREVLKYNHEGNMRNMIMYYATHFPLL